MAATEENVQPRSTSSGDTNRRRFALLDVDHTLLFHNTLNKALLQALLNAEIKDIYLFTDMILDLGKTQERMELVKTLQGLGFTVHGVITPADMAWNECDAEKAVEYMGNIEAERKEMRLTKFSGPRFETLLQNIYPKNPGLESVFNPTGSSGMPGKAYEDVSTTMTTREKETWPNFTAQSSFAKLVSTYQEEKRGLKHPKTLMLELFLKKHAHEASEVVIVDDSDEVIDALLPMKADIESPPVTIIHVADESLKGPFYRQALVKGHNEVFRLDDFDAEEPRKECLAHINTWLKQNKSSRPLMFAGKDSTRKLARQLQHMVTVSKNPDALPETVAEFLQTHPKVDNVLGANLREILGLPPQPDSEHKTATPVASSA